MPSPPVCRQIIAGRKTDHRIGHVCISTQAQRPNGPDTKNHMRSSKSRSRGNKTRNIRPTGGNIINRVFDSSGPDGKVRGTPAQIIEKYTQLHRDAQLSGDRVNAENFAQHAEHYTRILAEATREIDKAREEQEQFNRDRQADRDRQIERDRERQSERQNGNGGQQQDRPQDNRQSESRPQDNRAYEPRLQDNRQSDNRQSDNRQPEQRQQENRQPEPRHPDTRQQDRERDRQQRLRAQEEAAADPGVMDQPELPAFLVRGFDQPIIETVDVTADSGLVETPEARPRPQPRREDRRPPRQPRAEAPALAAVEEVPVVADAPVAEKPRTPRPRKPKPKPEATAEAGPAEAAE